MYTRGATLTLLVPILIALSLYVVLFLILLPLYRRHRSQIARYTNYAPLSSNLAQHTTSIFEPYVIEPSKGLIQKVKESIVRVVRWLVLPSGWIQDRGNIRGLGRPYSNGTSHEDNNEEEEDDHHGGLFDVESGEAMVGFSTLQEEGRQRRHGINPETEDDSNRRLSRDLEEGFRDDSGSEASDEEVTAGRRTLSRRASEVRRL